MAVVYADFVRERGKGGRTVKTYRAKSQRAKAYQRATAAAAQRVVAPVHARQGGAIFWMIMLLAPLAGLAAPLLAVPLIGEPQGWILAGAGLLACVLMLLRLAMHEADHAQHSK